MSPVLNGRVIFNEIPQGLPEVGKTLIYDNSQTIEPDTVPLNGGFLVKILNVSIDPYMRGRMRDSKIQSYSPAYPIGDAITGYAIGVAVRSENAEVKAGDHIYGIMQYQNYAVCEKLQGLYLRKVENKYKLPWSLFVGVLGMPGKTSYMAWKEYSHAKKGEVAFVSAGGGPVGSLVIQLAKLDGLKVIASAGSEEKVQFMKECGADVAFNYKTTDTAEVLAKEGPIDIFWDNVGGATLEAALAAANVGARFIECGMISGYNTGGANVRNLFHVTTKSITMQGFVVSRIQDKYEDEFYEWVAARVASGEIRHKEHVWEGLEKACEAVVAVLKGENKAKAVIHVADA